MSLTKHFTLAEMTVSQTAARLGISNAPDAAAIANLKRVCEALELVRALVGGPIIVSSGYRGPALNRAIGGSTSSAHMVGLAADFDRPGLTPKQVAQKIAASKIPFDQLILEYPDSGGWVHLGLSAGAPRRQVLTIKSGTGYMPGLL